MDNLVVTLSDICTEMKIEPRQARKALREATKDKCRYPLFSERQGSRTPWVWAIGSKELEEAKNILSQK